MRSGKDRGVEWWGLGSRGLGRDGACREGTPSGRWESAQVQHGSRMRGDSFCYLRVNREGEAGSKLGQA